MVFLWIICIFFNIFQKRVKYCITEYKINNQKRTENAQFQSFIDIEVYAVKSALFISEYKLLGYCDLRSYWIRLCLLSSTVCTSKYEFPLFVLQVSMRDLRLTFLPAFQKCVQAGAFSLMCSYNRSVLFQWYMLPMSYTCWICLCLNEFSVERKNL